MTTLTQHPNGPPLKWIAARELRELPSDPSTSGPSFDALRHLEVLNPGCVREERDEKSGVVEKVFDPSALEILQSLPPKHAEVSLLTLAKEMEVGLGTVQAVAEDVAREEGSAISWKPVAFDVVPHCEPRITTLIQGELERRMQTYPWMERATIERAEPTHLAIDRWLRDREDLDSRDRADLDRAVRDYMDKKSFFGMSFRMLHQSKPMYSSEEGSLKRRFVSFSAGQKYAIYCATQDEGAPLSREVLREVQAVVGRYYPGSLEDRIFRLSDYRFDKACSDIHDAPREITNTHYARAVSEPGYPVHWLTVTDGLWRPAPRRGDPNTHDLHGGTFAVSTANSWSKQGGGFMPSPAAIYVGEDFNPKELAHVLRETRRLQAENLKREVGGMTNIAFSRWTNVKASSIRTWRLKNIEVTDVVAGQFKGAPHDPRGYWVTDGTLESSGELKGASFAIHVTRVVGTPYARISHCLVERESKRLVTLPTVDKTGSTTPFGQTLLDVAQFNAEPLAARWECVVNRRSD